MPFMVIYRTADGSSSFEQADAIDEAALLVERLRNKEGIDQVRIYRMEEISFSFRPYYKVELGLPVRPEPAPPPEVVAVPVTPTPEPSTEPAPVPRAPSDGPAADDRPADVKADVPLPPLPDSDDEHAGANGRRGLFGR